MTLSAVWIFAGCGDEDSNKTKLYRSAAGKPGSTGGASGEGGAPSGTGGHGGKATTAGEAGSSETSGASGMGPASGGSSTAGGSTGVGGGAGEQPATGGTGGVGGSGDGGRSSGGKAGSAAGSGQAGGGAAGNGSGPRGLYVAVDGDDTASGLRSEPLATLAQAASTAKSGDTIVFLDGDHTVVAPDGGIVIPDGVNVIAENSGAVTVTSSSYVMLDVAGDSTIQGIHFDGAATVVSSTSPGTITIAESTFTNCTDYSLRLGGEAHVTMTGATTQEWTNCGYFAVLTYGGTVSVDGGIFRGAMPAPFDYVFAAFGASSRVELNKVQLTGGPMKALTVESGASATIVDSVVQLAASALIETTSPATLEISGSEIDGLGVADLCIQAYSDGVGELSLTNSSVHGCSIGITGLVPGFLGLTGVDIYDVANGALYFGQGSGLGGTIEIRDSTLTTNYETAATIADGNSIGVVDLTIRNTSITGGFQGLSLGGDAQPSPNTWDLGTLADPGGNTLRSDLAGRALVVATGSGSLVSAVGNTWHPSQQASDASGHYVLSSPGQVLDVTGGTGPNYQITSGTVRLAESAP